MTSNETGTRIAFMWRGEPGNVEISDSSVGYQRIGRRDPLLNDVTTLNITGEDNLPGSELISAEGEKECYSASYVLEHFSRHLSPPRLKNPLKALAWGIGVKLMEKSRGGIGVVIDNWDPSAPNKAIEYATPPDPDGSLEVYNFAAKLLEWSCSLRVYHATTVLHQDMTFPNRTLRTPGRVTVERRVNAND